MCPTGLGVIRGPKGYTAMDLERRVIDELGPLVGPAVLDSVGRAAHVPRALRHDPIRQRAGIRTETSTNITLLDEERGRQVPVAGLDVLYPATDGATKETYERVCVNAKWDRCCANVDRLPRA